MSLDNLVNSNWWYNICASFHSFVLKSCGALHYCVSITACAWFDGQRNLGFLANFWNFEWYNIWLLKTALAIVFIKSFQKSYKGLLQRLDIRLKNYFWIFLNNGMISNLIIVFFLQSIYLRIRSRPLVCKTNFWCWFFAVLFYVQCLGFLSNFISYSTKLYGIYGNVI